MESTVHGFSFGMALCNILGLLPHKVATITIEVNPGEVLVKITEILQKEEANEILEVLKQYKLTPIEENEKNNKT